MRIIAGEYRGRRIRTTEGPGYRPATGKVRESLFSMLESLGVDWSQTRVADIFAGSGSLGIEALSRGARDAVFVEKAAQAAALIRSNLEDLGVERRRCGVVKTDALRWLACGDRGPFGLVFIDPPYGKDLLLPTLGLLLEHGALAQDGIVCVEVEAGLRLENPPRQDLILLRDKLYGQTRICIWRRN
ncbi:16S rRNA (guanine966-N2)-methyltransferase [Desulfomicrobium apsheronum]|uniref:16S rRNA (Guanine966-N2)-methyltransferase n=1 Tax=Desulfomicrobium apsheronum TaxID=52560 RepID=A0A1I3X6Q6_9BACT|nr:16S rRNA (guanine(966)-N(2))-methyltransferase RsmD [Desulfomicrobium apsheronum]SFK14571.1 16S rRNA (guanine966-N2)-methyltransferase [Desulfomicrobium apsheronum]